MITAITGDLGSGKTYYAVNKIVYKAWRNGRDIYTNTALFFRSKGNHPETVITDDYEYFCLYDRIKWRMKSYCRPYLWKWFRLYKGVYRKQDQKFWRRNRELVKDTIYKRFWIPYSRGKITYFTDITEIIGIDNALIFIDEGSSILDAKNWKYLPRRFSESLRQSRKDDNDLVLTTQEMGQVDKDYRRLIMEWLECKKTWFSLWENPVVWGLFRASQHRISDYTRTENANTEDYDLEIIKKKWFPITIFKREKYNTNHKVGFHELKIVCLKNLNQKSDIKWCIIRKDLTYKEILMRASNLTRARKAQKHARG